MAITEQVYACIEGMFDAQMNLDANRVVAW